MCRVLEWRGQNKYRQTLCNGKGEQGNYVIDYGGTGRQLLRRLRCRGNYALSAGRGVYVGGAAPTLAG